MPELGENNNNPQQQEANLNNQPQVDANAQPQAAPMQGEVNPVPVPNVQAASEKDLAEHLKLQEDAFRKEEQILDLLKKRQDELLSYKNSQNELLDQREKEIDVFDVNKREKVEINYKKELPKDLAAYEKQSNADKAESTGKINEAIDELRNQQTSYTFPDKSIANLDLTDLSSYNSLVKEVDDIRKKIQEDGEKNQPNVDFGLVKKATDNYSAKEFGTGSYNLYKTNKKTYEEKEEAYQKEFHRLCRVYC